jgi:hypothetical protein
MSGIGKLASATASGISPDLNLSTITFKTFLTLSFILRPPLFLRLSELKKPSCLARGLFGE